MAYEELRARSFEVWTSGDYTPTSRQLEPASHALVAALGIAEGDRVLDVAAGLGNAALAAARSGAAVVATDWSPTMVAAGRQRTERAAVDVEWHEADATDLPFPDASFDVVTSVFGAIFAPEQEAVAAEVARVLRPGGRAGLTAWTPDGFTGRMLRARRAAVMGAEEAPDPFAWGRPETAEGHFAPTGCTVTSERDVLTFGYPTWEAWEREGSAHGTAVVARRTMTPADYAAMVEQMRRMTAAEAEDTPDGSVLLHSEYLRILVTKPA